MTPRLPFVALAAALALAGCNSDGAAAGDDDVELTDDPLAQFAYSAGYQQGQQYLGSDSSFNYDRFVEGFEAGLRGDSAEAAYAVGLQLGFDLAQDTLNVVDRDLLLAGVRAALRGDAERVTPEQFAAAQEVFQDTLFIRQLRSSAASDPQARQRLDSARRNQATADSFLTAAGRAQGVRRLDGGVLSVVEEPGDGAQPQPGDRVSVRYRGQLPDGRVFDESGEEAREFFVDQVVPGFRTALLDMRVGETRTVYLPPDQAYGLRGQQGVGGGIPPNSALQFSITLVDILDAPPPQPQFQIPPGMGQ